MGCPYSKPWKNTTDDIVGAYRWDERECGCGTNEFQLVEEPKADGGKSTNPPPEFSSLKDIVEPKLPDAVDLIMEFATRSCCCASLDFEPAIEALHKEWCPDINAQIESLGYSIDAFSWKEWHYNGQVRISVILCFKVMRCLLFAIVAIKWL